MEKNKIKITKMTLIDLDSIKDILISEYDDFWNYEAFKLELLSDCSLYFVAKYNELILGFIGIKIIFDQAELMNIVVKKDMRKNGIASLLLDYIISVCKEKKIKQINLEVNNQNTIAINLYNKYNLKQVGLRKKYYNNTDDAILMTRRITNE